MPQPMPNDDDTYRQSLRERLGLGKSQAKVVEEVPVTGVETEPVVAPMGAEAKEQVNPAAEAILNEVLQFVDEREDNAKEAAEKRMAKAFWVYLNDNKDKIHKIMVGKADKADKSV